MPKSLEIANTVSQKIDWLSVWLNCGLIGRFETLFGEIDFVETICQYFDFLAIYSWHAMMVIASNLESNLDLIKSTLLLCKNKAYWNK